jgi:hypothetical protein
MDTDGPVARGTTSLGLRWAMTSFFPKTSWNNVLTDFL